jgi:hypothetical protein
MTKDQRREYKKAWREKNKEKVAASSKAWREKSKKKIAAEHKAYRQTLEGIYSLYKYNAKKRNISFKISIEEFQTFWQKPCRYCGDQLDTVGIDRADNNIGYELDNLRPCCTVCNRMKSNYSEQEFLDKILKIYKIHC